MKGVQLIIVISFIIFNLSNGIVEAQLSDQTKIDSLLKELPKAKQDTNHVNLLLQLAFGLFTKDPDKGIEYVLKGVELSKKLTWKIGEAKCYNTLGIMYSFGKSDYPNALKYYHKSFKISEELGDKSGVARNLGGIGIIYESQSDYPKALEYYHKSLKIFEELFDKSGIATNLANIGNIYESQSDYPKALEYYHKSLKIYEELGNKSGVASNLGNIGSIYNYQSDYPKALEYYLETLKIYEELGNKSGIAVNLGNIGTIYEQQSDYPKALEYYQKALTINEELGNKSEIAINLGNMGSVYYKLSQDTVLSKISEATDLVSLIADINLNRSIEYSLQSIKIFEEVRDLKSSSEVYKNLSDAYFDKGDYKKAYDAYVEYKDLRDSIFNMDKAKEIETLSATREKEITEKENIILKTEKKAQQFQSYLLAAGVIIFFAAFGIAFLRFSEKKKLSDKLAFQNAEVNKQKAIVEEQKEILQEKNTEIIDSINYAATIQNALLPWSSVLGKIFKEHFIIYKPKNIVSGDSYWFQYVDGIKYLAVIDCTGHGVPGSMLTVIANSVLDDAVLSKKLLSTSDILTYMNEKVTEVLNQRLAENNVRDGMEVGLIAIHKEKIQFSGAGRPLYIKNGTMEIIKTDKRGIAGQNDNDVFNYSSVEIEKTDNLVLYLASDGYADQMNENSKKYSTKLLLETLDRISELPFEKQKEIIENEFNTHRGSREQIDDVTVIGIKI